MELSDQKPGDLYQGLCCFKFRGMRAGGVKVEFFGLEVFYSAFAAHDSSNKHLNAYVTTKQRNKVQEFGDCSRKIKMSIKEIDSQSKQKAGAKFLYLLQNLSKKLISPLLSYIFPNN